MSRINVKEFPKRILIFICLLVLLILIGTLGFKFLLKIPLKEAFVVTLESFALISHQDSGIAKFFGVFITLFGVILLWWILWSIFDMLLEGNFTEYLKIRKILSRLEKMKDHYIIAGGGRVGEELAKDFSRRKIEYIIIEKEIATFSRLKKAGFFAIHGDVTNEAVLKQAGIKQARALVLAMPETEKNLLVTMIGKEINPQVDIYARADKPAFVSKLKKAGAKVVIVPELVAAEKFLEAIK
jgi:voltage-gated potassium channel